MTPTATAYAVELIMSASKKRQGPCLLYLIRTPGSDAPWPTDRVPVGRSSYVIVGRYDRHITLDELHGDLIAADREFRRGAAA